MLWMESRWNGRVASSLCVGLMTASLVACGGGSGEDASAGSEGEASESAETTAEGGDLPAALPERIAVTADFKAQSLSILDAEALLNASAGTTAAEVVVDTIDLGAWAPGPLEVEFIPGTREVLVSVSPGFFGSVVGGLIMAGEVDPGGALLRVDLESREVTGTLTRDVPPMGIAVTADGSTAYIADFGNEDQRGNTVSIVDLESFTVTGDVVVGSGPEQLDLSSDGTKLIVNAAGPGTVRTFELADPSGSLSEPLSVSGDPSWVSFVEGSDQAVVTNSSDPANWMVVDFTDPGAPAILAEGDAVSGFPYALTHVAGQEWIMTSMTVGRFEWHESSVDGASSTNAATHTIEGITVFPLGIAVDATAGKLVVPMAGVDALGVIDIETEALVQIDWVGAPGPTYVVLEG